MSGDDGVPLDDPHRSQGGKFKSGVSGNPRGRPRKDRSVTGAITKAAQETVHVTENGRKRKITKLDATAKQLVNKGASGDLRASKMVFDMAKKAELEAAETRSKAPETLPEADLEIAGRWFLRVMKIVREGEGS